MKSQRLKFKEFKYFFSRVRRLCIELIIQTKDGILLSKRDIPPAKGKWHIPGGTVLYGETLEQAVSRVAEDELSVKVKIIKQLGTIEYSRNGKSGYEHPLGIAYLVSIVSGKLRGSYQAKNIKAFQTLPKAMIFEQKKFLENYVK